MKKGIASLPVILLLGGIIITIGITGAFLLIYLNNSLYGTRLSNEALEAAQSGINDAIMRVIVNKDLIDSYEITLGSSTATVTICKDVCDGVSIGQDKITSVGRSFTKQHQLVAVLNVSSTTGWVTIQSIEEVVQ